jgi:hypothetical protein
VTRAIRQTKRKAATLIILPSLSSILLK